VFGAVEGFVGWDRYMNSLALRPVILTLTPLPAYLIFSRKIKLSKESHLHLLKTCDNFTLVLPEP
jgi:hypothetical protein